MGQQQLILLVLATVIVGLAIVVGIAAFTQGGDRANADAMIQDAVTMASDIQSTIRTPTPFGGVDDFDEISFGVLGYPIQDGFDPDQDDAIYTNGNGEFQLNASSDCVIITGRSSSDPSIDTDLTDTNADQKIQVAVRNLTEEGIEGATLMIGGQDTGATELNCGTPDNDDTD